MTQEEKAKAYDKAIAHAKILLKTIGNATLGNLVLKNEFENMFPELRESEDERIRKELLNAFQEAEDSLYMVLTPNRRKSFIAWLEKQGNLMKALQISNANIGELVEKNYYLKEQLEKQGNNMGISEATKQKLEDNLNKALEKETPKSFNEFLDEQGEKKPIFRVGDTIGKVSTGDVVTISEVDIKNKEYRLTNTGFIPFEYESLWQLVEQKPAWSEEDEDVINHLLAICAGAKRYRRQFAGCLQEDITKYQTWLKSLKPQNHWKPSDEQMDAIDYVKNFDYGGYKDMLVSLYYDLKKLKDE